MHEYGAFLRGVNVGRHRRIGSEDLRAVLEAVGLANVATFRTSGNVVFSGVGGRSSADLQTAIEARLATALGGDVVVFLRNAGEMRRIAAHKSFPPDVVAASHGKLQVMLLHESPAQQTRDAVLALATGEDRLAFGERELYWLPSGGVLDSNLDRDAIPKLLGTTTTRTMGTMEQLVAKYFAS